MACSDALAATEQLMAEHPDREDLPKVLSWLEQQDKRWLREPTATPVPGATEDANREAPAQTPAEDTDKKKEPDPPSDDGPQLGLF